MVRWVRSIPNRSLLVLASLLVLWPVVVFAEPAVETEAIKDWPSPLHTSPYAAAIDNSVDGVTVMTLERGDDSDCVIVHSGSERAVAYEYRHQFETTHCLTAVAHPDGGFFVRGQNPESSNDSGQGFTSRISADGELLWSVEDHEFFESTPHPSGIGVFSGEYGGPLGPLAFDVDTDRLMGLTLGLQLLPDGEAPLIQAHLIDGETGTLKVAGQSFGPLANDRVIDLVAREGEFLVHTLSGADETTRFYSHEGRRNIAGFEPDGADWSRHQIVSPIQYHSESGTFILWTDQSDAGPTTAVTRVEGLDSVVWSEEYSREDLVTGELEELGAPERLWVGNRFAALLSKASNRDRFLRFIDIEDGTDLGVVRWDSLVDFDPLAMVRDDHGELNILAVDPDVARLWQYSFQLTDGDSSELHDGSSRIDDEDVESGCSTTRGGSFWSMILVLAMAGLVRRQSLRKVRSPTNVLDELPTN